MPSPTEFNIASFVSRKPHVIYLGIVAVLGVFLSTGYLYPDEHYQIIEFANALIGRGAFSELAWEYESRIRPWLQPAIAALFLKIGFLFTDSPFVAIKFVKAFFAAGFFSAAVYYTSADGESVDGLSPRARVWGGTFIATSAIVAQMISRTSSEAFSAVWLMVLLGFMARAFAIGKIGNSREHLICGAIAGLMFYTRFQTGFIYAAVGLWLTFARRVPPRLLAANLLGFFLVGVFCTALDSFLYGRSSITPLLYFKINIVEGVASKFGVSPWYGYFVDFNTAYRHAAGVLSYVSMLILILRKPGSLLAWVFWFFVLGHSAIAHKEERFLFPVMIIAPMAWAIFVDLLANAKNLRPQMLDSVRRGVKIFVVLSGLYGVLIAARPLGQRYGMLELIDKNARRQDTPACLEWAVDDGKGALVPKFYSTANIRVFFADNFTGHETYAHGCLAAHSALPWYEVRKMSPHQYFSVDYLQRGSLACRKENNLDVLLADLISKERILSVISFLNWQGEQLYLWRCG